MTRALSVTLVALALLVTGCGDAPDRAPEPRSASGPPTGSGPVRVVAEERADLRLWVSNQSVEDGSVGITITVDGVPVVDHDFEVGSQHNWQLFPVALEPGRHTLHAESDTGAVREVAFRIPQGRQRHAVVDYWGEDDADGPSLTWLIQREPVAFM